MPRKALEVKVELDLQGVTCPGVWLCPNGKVSIQLYMLGSCIQTTSREPVFPLIYHETFIFYKTYHNVNLLSKLQKTLSKEWMYAELIQWQNCEFGNVLASFKTTLSELLYPNTKEGVIPGVEIDLLMEPSKTFPGIIAPKIEVSTRTTIEEKLCVNEMNCDSYVVNPKVLSSKTHIRPTVFRQRKVCHSAGYHGAKQYEKRPQQEKKEIFMYRKVDDNLIARKPQGLTITEKYCNCKSSQNVRQDMNAISPNVSPIFERKNLKVSKTNVKWCKKINPKNPETYCTHGGDHGDCPICAKYKYYFESPQETAVSHFKQSSRCAHHPNKICHCPVRKPDDKLTTRSKDSKKLCLCSDDGRNSFTCCCSQTSKKSLAAKLHDKLSRTLKCPECSFGSEGRTVVRDFRSTSPVCESTCSPLQCQINEDVLSDKCLEWYGNFDRFYKNFYKEKRNTCDRYIAC